MYILLIHYRCVYATFPLLVSSLSSFSFLLIPPASVIVLPSPLTPRLPPPQKLESLYVRWTCVLLEWECGGRFITYSPCEHYTYCPDPYIYIYIYIYTKLLYVYIYINCCGYCEVGERQTPSWWLR